MNVETLSHCEHIKQETFKFFTKEIFLLWNILCSIADNTENLHILSYFH